MFKKSLILTVLLTISTFSSSAFALIGFGINWGRDFTIRMDNVSNEQVRLDALILDNESIPGQIPITNLNITDNLLPLYISRENLERTPLNIGVKLYVDILPFIDAIELSTNFAWWEYDGKVLFPSKISYKSNVDPTQIKGPEDLFETQYDTLDISLDKFGMEFWGFHKTPYMKLQFDLTVRKYIYQFPAALKTFKLYGGAGLSLVFSTPVLSNKLIQDALRPVLESVNTIEDLRSEVFDNYDISKKIVKEITSNLMVPHWGCHIDLGVMIKVPVIPVGVYFDGKILIPFKEPDSRVDLGGSGFLFNTGIAFHL
ncbi:MAG: hypothetical protein Q4F84_04820 [Fibrobacter sp.]|nr:hypothetical protein [Fibrobacter sp.]